MTLDDLLQSTWYPELQSDIETALKELLGNESGNPAPQLRELDSILKKKEGWKISLSDSNLPRSIRDEIHAEYEQTNIRERELNLEMQRCQNRQKYLQTILDPSLILNCLNRLDEVLSGDNATLGNLELSLHIDRIVCFNDGHVTMRVCRLGALSECVELMSSQNLQGNDPVQDDFIPKYSGTVKPRRRAKLRVESIGSEGKEQESIASFVTDPNRFAGLDDEWFEEFEFDVPEKLSWSQIHAEEVFNRRQKSKLPLGKLAEEFGVTRPTIGNAIKYYLKTHPDAVDNVALQCGGKRPPKFDLSTFGDEARDLWEAGWSKLKLAKKFGCSPPTIDKAMAWSYAKDGLTLPTKEEREKLTTARARTLFDEGNTFNEISVKMNISDVTVRRYLKMSFEAEGKTMPDLRRGNSSTH